MELREIESFLQVAQWGSFSRAAKQLGYSQAAVTIQVKQLERELNVHLFDRIGKRTTLTHQGMVFHEYAVKVMRELTQAKEAITDAEEPNGRLCLGTIESICASVFPELLAEYHRRYPKVNISIVTDSPEALLEMMNNNVIDLVYFLDKRLYDTKWVKRLEEPEDAVFVASAKHPRVGTEFTLDQMLQESFILTEQNASYRFILEQYLASLGKEIHPFLEIGNTEFIINLLKKGNGVSFLPRFTVQKEIEAGELAILQVKDFHMQVWRQIVYHKDKWVHREMAEFLRLVEEMEDNAESSG